MSVSQAKAVCEFLSCALNDIFLVSEVNLINRSEKGVTVDYILGRETEARQ